MPEETVLYKCVVFVSPMDDTWSLGSLNRVLADKINPLLREIYVQEDQDIVVAYSRIAGHNDVVNFTVSQRKRA